MINSRIARTWVQGKTRPRTTAYLPDVTARTRFAASASKDSLRMPDAKARCQCEKTWLNPSPRLRRACGARCASGCCRWPTRGLFRFPIIWKDASAPSWPACPGHPDYPCCLPSPVIRRLSKISGMNDRIGSEPWSLLRSPNGVWRVQVGEAGRSRGRCLRAGLPATGVELGSKRKLKRGPRWGKLCCKVDCL